MPGKREVDASRELVRRTFDVRRGPQLMRVTCRTCLVTWWHTADDIRYGATLTLIEHAQAHQSTRGPGAGAGASGA